MRFLLDEMSPPDAAVILRDEHGHDAFHVGEVGMRGTDDTGRGSVARDESRVLVTENVGHFSGEPDLVLVCVLERKLPAGGGQARALADILHRWARDHPRPYLGQHWPTS